LITIQQNEYRFQFNILRKYSLIKRLVLDLLAFWVSVKYAHNSTAANLICPVNCLFLTKAIAALIFIKKPHLQLMEFRSIIRSLISKFFQY